MNLSQAEEILKKHNQEHILSFWNKLEENEKSSLLEQVENIDFNLLDELYKLATSNNDKKLDNISPLSAIKKMN